ncbi:MAG: MmgE/PrpD family protein, partial [Proteobacteria bacterium]|nr:MmgE/PrpD family protein [Pseudomonadota bacterium]
MKSRKSSGFTTGILAEFISSLSPDMIPATAFETAKKCIIDIAAASLAGFKMVSSKAAKDMAKDLFSTGTSSVWFSGESLNAPGAAYVNSSFASALDLDDGHRKAMGHPGAAIIPAALAVAEEINASGIDFLTAVVIGYEIAVRVASARDHEKLDTLSSGKWCPYGVVAAGGWLYKLSPHKLAQAISIAGVQAPELSASGYSKIMGNNVKEGIPWSTVTGLSALMLARNNYSGPLDILDHPGFYDSKKIISGFGKNYAIENVYFKPYACCRWIHSAIDALLILMDIHDLKQEQISGIDVFLFKRALMLTNQTCPETLEGAQYSVQYSMAVAAV